MDYYNIDTDESSYVDSSSDSDGDDTEDDMKEMTEEEKEDTKYLSIFESEYNDFDEKIMSLESLEALKKMEGSMIDRTNKGYYRCKIRDHLLYEECIAAMSKNCTEEMMAMLQHDKSTQPNEAMNHSVASSAPKTKTFSKSSSLTTRIMLVAGAQIIGHCELWKRVFNLFDLQIDKNLVRHLTKKDENKNKRRAVQKTKEYKFYRSAKRYDKYAKAHTDQLDDMKTGAQYETGVAVALAKKTIKSAPRNPPGTLPEKWKCPFFHPDYCQKLGHTGCRSADCHMTIKKTTKEERDVAMKIISEEAIAMEMTIAMGGKSR